MGATEHTSIEQLQNEIRQCTLCAVDFAATRTGHKPRPVVWFAKSAPIMICGQAPGMRVHETGIPFNDRSGDRLRDWLGISREAFYDRTLTSILPTAFCFPGYSAKGADLPPAKRCWETWHHRCLASIGRVDLKILVCGYAISRHISKKQSLTEAVSRWRDYTPNTFLLPHPSWRNNAWLKKNPWFESDLLPELKATVRATIDTYQDR